MHVNPVLPVAAPRQCVILVGGLGTRLGALTAAMPKPLLPVAGMPFLSYLIKAAARFGFTKILLLAGFRADLVQAFVETQDLAAALHITIEIAIETKPRGTAGALLDAASLLDASFYMINGDSWFDVNWLALLTARSRAPQSLVTMALRQVDDPDRYGLVAVEAIDQATMVTGFAAAGERCDNQSAIPARHYVNAGIYFMSRRILMHCNLLQPDASLSLERDVFPHLASLGLLTGHIYADPEPADRFIDIGLPADYAASQQLLPAWQVRPALFIDRDGTLIADKPYLHRADQCEFLPGAIAALRAFNDAGYLVFLVTNQAGIGHGFFGPTEVDAVHRHLQDELRRHGAHLDDIRYCPFHPQAADPAYRRESAQRKPGPGMLNDLLAAWPVDRARSLMIGNEAKDVEAGLAAGLAAYQCGPEGLALQALAWLGDHVAAA